MHASDDDLNRTVMIKGVVGQDAGNGVFPLGKGCIDKGHKYLSYREKHRAAGILDTLRF